MDYPEYPEEGAGQLADTGDLIAEDLFAAILRRDKDEVLKTVVF